MSISLKYANRCGFNLSVTSSEIDGHEHLELQISKILGQWVFNADDSNIDVISDEWMIEFNQFAQ